MTASIKTNVGFHDQLVASHWGTVSLGHWETQFTYTFQNFFHPFVGELIAKLNRDSLTGMMDAAWLDNLKRDFFSVFYNPSATNLARVIFFPEEIDVEEHRPYAIYNWELFFHIPLTVAVHLSKTRRFAEAQRWFHYIFDPTSNDQTVDPPNRFWKFLAFRQERDPKQIDALLALLSKPPAELSPDDQQLQADILNGYQAILNKPFQPHAVARTRHLAYQYCVVMKYLDNLIAWGDDLFQQDTVESINEATQLYVLAANLLGPRPERIPPRGMVQPKTFAQIKAKGLDPMSNALVELEGQFPFNLAMNEPGGNNGGDGSGSLFGIGRTLYFCIPRNDKLLGYWDTVADRLFKIRHCMNIQGVVRPLALFDLPIDPGMLVKATAAGLDLSGIVSGLTQPVGPVRCLILIQKALELCGEVRGLGNTLLSAIEKGDAEHLALVRQRHEIQIQQMAQEVRFLQWKQAQETTQSLLTGRAASLERLRYFQRLLGLPADPDAPDTLGLDHHELTEENFDEAYDALVAQYDKPLALQKLPDLKLAGDSSPGILSGFSGSGKVHLTVNEDKELNTHLPRARDARLIASAANVVASTVTFVPDAKVHGHYWGIGVSATVTGGQKLAIGAKILAEIAQIYAAWEQDQAGMTSRYASYERRADEWLLQYNLAALELMQIGRQILTSLIAEQIARHEYQIIQKQVANAQEVDQFFRDKFTNEDLYLWMQGEISRLYYEYYRFAFETARKAEQTMKREVMRPEVDATDYIKFNYWDGGRRGLLSGEALHLDIKRMEMAYHENNKREYELTKHVSLRQLNPLALLTFKTTGGCEFTVPEWAFDLDSPGHYMRRIRNASLSIPSVAGPYTGVNCTVSLLRSSLRKSPLDDDYARRGSKDERFIDYFGTIQSIVTSTGNNDSGLFETNLRDERFLPFEGAGAESTWKLELPGDFRQFDYDTISDVILHLRYTARQGGTALRDKASQRLKELIGEANTAGLGLLFSLKHEFPSEWHRFNTGTDNFVAVVKRDHFPYFTQGKEIAIDALQIHTIEDGKLGSVAPQGLDLDAFSETLKGEGAFELSLAPDGAALVRNKGAYVFILIKYSVGPV